MFDILLFTTIIFRNDRSMTYMTKSQRVHFQNERVYFQNGRVYFKNGRDHF